MHTDRSTTEQHRHKNLAALRVHHPELHSQLVHNTDDSHVEIRQAKTGNYVPCIVENDRSRPLHSLYDPAKEANRYVQSLVLNGFNVVLGLGGGYHIFPMLARDFSECLIIETDPAAVWAFLACTDMTKIIQDPRVTLMIDPAENQVADYIRNRYLPAISGDFATSQLKARVEGEHQFYSLILEEIKHSVSDISSDFATQAAFGLKWFSNMIANLDLAEKSAIELPQAQSVKVIAAGPSLEIYADALAQRDNSVIVAVDSSLPYLEARGITPDYVITIDCQAATYHHFLGSDTASTVIADLATSPSVLRNRSHVGFFSSDHPFSHYLRTHWRSFPYVDVSGGNVTYAAISFATNLGAKEISVYGADFAYPNGKIYARGTYLLKYFMLQENRRKPNESLVLDYIFGDASTTRNEESGFNVFSSERMQEYRYKTLALIQSLGIPVTLADFRGITTLPVKASAIHEPYAKHQGPQIEPIVDVINNYVRALEQLPITNSENAPLIDTLSVHEKEIISTLLPIAAGSMKHRQKKSKTWGRKSILEARETALAILKRSSFTS